MLRVHPPNFPMRFLLFCPLLLLACTPNATSKLQTTTTTPLPPTERVYVLQVNDVLPEDSEFIGEFKVGSATLSTDCTYEVALEIAKKHARAQGANILYVSQIKVPPGFGTMCYRLRGKMYRSTTDAATAQLTATEKARLASRLPTDADFARVYFFRPPVYAGSAVRYKVYDEAGQELGKMSNGSHWYIDVKELGPTTFYAKNVESDSIRLNLEAGREYFVQSWLKTGWLVAAPALHELPADFGRVEYERTREKGR